MVEQHRGLRKPSPDWCVTCVLRIEFKAERLKNNTGRPASVALHAHVDKGITDEAGALPAEFAREDYRRRT